MTPEGGIEHCPRFFFSPLKQRQRCCASVAIQCMVDVVLDSIAPDEAALKSPDRERWCKGVSRSVQGYYCCGDCYIKTDTRSCNPREHDHKVIKHV